MMNTEQEVLIMKKIKNRRRKNVRRMCMGILLTGCVALGGNAVLSNKEEIFSALRPMLSQASAGKYEEKDDKRDEKEAWNLILVNPWNEMPEGFEVELTQLKDGQAVDSRIYPELQQMLDDARKEGLIPYVNSSYRTNEKQIQLLKDEIKMYQEQGYSKREAEKIAKQWVAVPGTSEHQLGLAVDITSADRNVQSPYEIWEWLAKHSWKYGFILRYTEEKQEITGIMPEEWHYRYVGKEAAREIYEQGICLEEYLEKR